MDKAFIRWPFFTPHHADLLEALEDWVAHNLPVDHADVDAACRRLVRQLGEDGWLQHSAPDPAAPESGFDVRTLCLIRETLARHDGLADFAFAMQGLGAGAISLFGSDAQRHELLSQSRAGKAITAFALTEPEAGSDVANLSTRAELAGNEYVINGEKTWISNGGIADYYVLFARTGEAPGAKGLSAFLIPASSKGFSVEERLDVIAPHPLARLQFKDMAVPQSALIGQQGEGFKIAMSVLDVFRSTVGAAALGFARRALSETIDHVRRRELFGAPLAELQMVQGHIADMALSVDSSALMIYRAAWTRDQGAARISREAAMAKLLATEEAQKVIDQAVQLHGGAGVQKGNVVEQLYREIRALRIYEGATDVQKQIIARQTLAGG